MGSKSANVEMGYEVVLVRSINERPDTELDSHNALHVLLLNTTTVSKVYILKDNPKV